MLVEEDNDAILVELCEREEQLTKVKVSPWTMGRIIQKLNLTCKKNTSCALNETWGERKCK